jgi:hypothetical protein
MWLSGAEPALSAAGTRQFVRRLVSVKAVMWLSGAQSGGSPGGVRAARQAVLYAFVVSSAAARAVTR